MQCCRFFCAHERLDLRGGSCDKYSAQPDVLPTDITKPIPIGRTCNVNYGCHIAVALSDESNFKSTISLWYATLVDRSR